MSPIDESLNVNAGADVRSIQITINLCKQTGDVPPGPNETPQGVLVRHAFSEPGANQQKKVRLSFVPDDMTQNPSSHTFAANPGEPTKWLELLGDPVGLDIDTGIIILRMTETGGLIAWLPENTTQEPIYRQVKHKSETEPGGVSYGDYVACWIANGCTAEASVRCLDKL